MIMKEEQIYEALNKHWHASAAGDANAEHDIYHEDVVCDYPQSGERNLGRSNLQALRSHHPGKPSGFNVKRILGKGDLWITEYTITYQGRPAYTVSIMEFRDGKVVHETQYLKVCDNADSDNRAGVTNSATLKASSYQLSRKLPAAR
jgi:SnoaL-like protein